MVSVDIVGQRAYSRAVLNYVFVFYNGLKSVSSTVALWGHLRVHYSNSRTQVRGKSNKAAQWSSQTSTWIQCPNLAAKKQRRDSTARGSMEKNSNNNPLQIVFIADVWWKKMDLFCFIIIMCTGFICLLSKDKLYRNTIKPYKTAGPKGKIPVGRISIVALVTGKKSNVRNEADRKIWLDWLYPSFLENCSELR